MFHQALALCYRFHRYEQFVDCIDSVRENSNIEGEKVYQLPVNSMWKTNLAEAKTVDNQRQKKPQ